MTLIKDQPPPQDMTDQIEPMILVPYVEAMLHAETVDSVRAAGYPYALWPIDRQDPYAYGALLADQWNRGGDLVVVEQDIVVPGGAIDALLKCEHLWCSHLYDCNNEVPSYGLGLCRFTAYVQQRYPSLAEQAARSYLGKARRMRYEALNERIITLMNHWGYRIHLHEPQAEHLHDYGRDDAAAR